MGPGGLEPPTSSLSGPFGCRCHMRQNQAAMPWRYPRVTVTPHDHPPHRARSRHDLPIRRSGHIVQARPLLSARAGPTFQRCPHRTGVVQRLGNSIGYSRCARGISPDRPFFRPDISPVGLDRASVMRCHRSLLSAVGCCCHPQSTTSSGTFTAPQAAVAI